MPAWFTRCALALGGAVALFTVAGGLPAQAAGPATSAPSAPASAYSTLTAPPVPGPASPEMIRLATRYLHQHPFQGHVTVLQAPSLHLPPVPALPAVPAAGTLTAHTGSLSAWGNWWGIRVYLTSNDLHNLFVALTIYGFNAVADAICAPGGALALFCGAMGIVVGYIVAQAVWYTWGYRGGCGLYVDIYWNGYWRSWGC